MTKDSLMILIEEHTKLLQNISPTLSLWHKIDKEKKEAEAKLKAMNEKETPVGVPSSAQAAGVSTASVV